MARPDKHATDASTAVLEQTTESGTEVIAVEFHKKTPSTLANTDLSALTPEQLTEWSAAAQDRLKDLTSSVYADKRTGCVYIGDRIVGNVNRPIKATAVIPSVLKVKDENVDAKGVVTVPPDARSKGMTTLDTYLVAVVRFSMARITGNGVSLLGQRSKDDTGVATALGSIKSAMA